MYSPLCFFFDGQPGLYPYYDITRPATIEQKVIDGERPTIDDTIFPLVSQSPIERRLVELMGQCHIKDTAERFDIFQVVAHLRETQQLTAGSSHLEHSTTANSNSRKAADGDYDPSRLEL